MELIKGKWYKIKTGLGYIKYFKYLETDMFKKCWYDCSIKKEIQPVPNAKFSNTPDWLDISCEMEECPLSEIQQYLPEGHPDKEFVLPEKWCVKDCKEVSKWASEVFRCGYLVNSSAYLCVDKKKFPNFNSYFFYDEDSACNYTEITFYQFKKYVLKTKEMEEREIIGYKLKEDCEKYIPALNEVCKCFSFGNHRFDIGSVYYEAFEEAGVLNLWFEPIFKEKFKIGDWVMETWASSQYYNLKAFRIIRINDKLVVYDRQGECNSIASNLRLATPEEIKKTLVEEAIKRGFKEGVKVISLIHNKDLFCNNTINGFEYYPDYDKLHFGIDGVNCVVIYEKGKWAEILPSYPQIEINGYKGEFFDDYVKFGCAKISREVFIDSNKLFKHNSESVFDYTECNRSIESMTIGKGTFTKDQIKQIAEYYLNKK